MLCSAKLSPTISGLWCCCPLEIQQSGQRTDGNSSLLFLHRSYAFASAPVPVMPSKGFQGFAVDAVHMPVSVDKNHPFLAAVATCMAVKESISIWEGLVYKGNEVVFHGSFLVHVETELQVYGFSWLRVLSMFPYCLNFAHQSRV